MLDTFKYLRYRLRHALPRGNGGKLVLTALLVLALPVGVVLVRQVQRYTTDAALPSVSLTFSPAQQNMPPDSTFKIIADTKTNQIGFIRVVFTIDPSKINLTSEVSVTNKLATIVEKTSMGNINATGTGVIVAALAPTDRENPLTGIVELASFSVKSVSSTPNGATTLSMTNAEIQLIDMQSNILPFTSQSSSIILNATVPTGTTVSATGTAIPTVVVPTATGTLIPTNTPTVTKTPTVTSTLIPTQANATSTPVATATTTLPSATTAVKAGDVNKDGVVNSTDIGLIVDAYGTQPVSDARADLNKDGKVNIVDVGLVIDNYGL